MVPSRLSRSALIFTLALVFGLIGSIAPLGTSARTPVEQTPWGGVSQAENLALAHALIDRVLNGRGPLAAAELVDDDASIQTPYGTFTGPEGLIDYLGIVTRAYPDATFEVTSVVAEENTVTISWTMRATRFQIEPSEPPITIRAEIPGVVTIGIQNDQVAALSLENGDIATTSPQPVAYEARPGQPY